MPVTPAVPYLLTGLAGCSVGREISRGARKLTRTPILIKIIIIIDMRKKSDRNATMKKI